MSLGWKFYEQGCGRPEADGFEAKIRNRHPTNDLGKAGPARPWPSLRRPSAELVKLAERHRLGYSATCSAWQIPRLKNACAPEPNTSFREGSLKVVVPTMPDMTKVETILYAMRPLARFPDGRGFGAASSALNGRPSCEYSSSLRTGRSPSALSTRMVSDLFRALVEFFAPTAARRP